MLAFVERVQVCRAGLLLAADVDFGVLVDGESFGVAFAGGHGLAFLLLVVRFDGDGILLDRDDGAVDAMLPGLVLPLGRGRRLRHPHAHGNDPTQNQAKTTHVFLPVYDYSTQ